jgi:hypothetical protein
MTDPAALIAVVGATVAALGAIALVVVELRRAARIVERARAIADVPAEPDRDVWADGLADLDWSAS